MLANAQLTPCFADEQHRDVFDRAPIGLQLIGHRFREEELLGVMGSISKALSS
jgi:Asp-tRNA(Asn)/Glu-tRNA(Gln) amidotransferase A subunit family amidase